MKGGGIGQTFAINTKIEVRDALYRYLYTVYCQLVTDFRRLTDKFDKR
jgi:hypothetical protein